uniref:PITH domain-containing protein n=1 Tax=Panagrellus redivivus TaxID=6233 RepID=A0A7E4ZQN3_PANRE
MMDQHATKRHAEDEMLLEGAKKPRTLFSIGVGGASEYGQKDVANDDSLMSTPDEEDGIIIDNKNLVTAPQYSGFKIVHFLPLPIIVVHTVDDEEPVDLSTHPRPVSPLNGNPPGMLFMQVGPHYQGGKPFYLEISKDHGDKTSDTPKSRNNPQSLI